MLGRAGRLSEHGQGCGALAVKVNKASHAGPVGADDGQRSGREARPGAARVAAVGIDAAASPAAGERRLGAAGGDGLAVNQDCDGTAGAEGIGGRKLAGDLVLSIGAAGPVEAGLADRRGLGAGGKNGGEGQKGEGFHGVSWL